MNTYPDSIAADFARFEALIDGATRDSIPDSGDRPIHVRELAAALVRLDPATFGEVSALLSEGDGSAAERVARAALARLGAAYPWLMYPADGYKRAYRMALRKHIRDMASADATAHRDCITTARRELAKLAEMHSGDPGWRLCELEEAGEALRLRETADAEADEKGRAAKWLATRRAREKEALAMPVAAQSRRRRNF